MKLLLVYPPFCTPTVPPHSITYIKGFLDQNSNIDTRCLDLNVKFHKMRFPEPYDKLSSIKNREKNDDKEDGKARYFKLLDDFDKASRPVYAANHRSIVNGKKPEFFDELLDIILREKPDMVGLSIVYSSQAFYAREFIIALAQRNIRCVVGGPAVNSILKGMAQYLKDEDELLDYLDQVTGKLPAKKTRKPSIPDFSIYPETDYLWLERILPLRTSRSCYYRNCAFCTHYSDEKYVELPLADITEAIIKNNAEKVFFIDDMISGQRLLKIAEAIRPLKVRWWCQLRPTKDLLGGFAELKKSGLSSISWGVESGCQHILDRMRKGTRVEIVQEVLRESHDAGILNIVYIIFGFPGETKLDFFETIRFLKENKQHIDLVSTTIFGLQKRSFVYQNQELYGITEVLETKRTVLDEKISYKVKSGMQNKEAKEMRKNYIITLKKLNKLPKVLNYFKEQTLL